MPRETLSYWDDPTFRAAVLKSNTPASWALRAEQAPPDAPTMGGMDALGALAGWLGGALPFRGGMDMPNVPVKIRWLLSLLGKVGEREGGARGAGQTTFLTPEALRKGPGLIRAEAEGLGKDVFSDMLRPSGAMAPLRHVPGEAERWQELLVKLVKRGEKGAPQRRSRPMDEIPPLEP